MSMFKSNAQSRWAHTKKGTKALGGKKAVKEWEADTDYSSLPEHVAPKPKEIIRMRHTAS